MTPSGRASVIASAVLGALALLTKYKNDDGKVTTGGRVALAGVVLSAVISLASQMLEASRKTTAAGKARGDAKAQAAALTDVPYFIDDSVEFRLRSGGGSSAPTPWPARRSPGRCGRSPHRLRGTSLRSGNQRCA